MLWCCRSIKQPTCVETWILWGWSSNPYQLLTNMGMNGYWLCTMMMDLPSTKWNTHLCSPSVADNPMKMTPLALKGEHKWLYSKCAKNWILCHTGQASESVHECSRMQCVGTTSSGHPTWLPQQDGQFLLASLQMQCWVLFAEENFWICTGSRNTSSKNSYNDKTRIQQWDPQTEQESLMVHKLPKSYGYQHWLEKSWPGCFRICRKSYSWTTCHIRRHSLGLSVALSLRIYRRPSWKMMTEGYNGYLASSWQCSCMQGMKNNSHKGLQFRKIKASTIQSRPGLQWLLPVLKPKETLAWTMGFKQQQT